MRDTQLAAFTPPLFLLGPPEWVAWWGGGGGLGHRRAGRVGCSSEAEVEAAPLLRAALATHPFSRDKGAVA